MKEVERIAGTFNPITLSEMDDVKLLDRTDTKYVFNISQLPDVLEKIKGNFRLLDIDGVRLNKYETLYYDTQNFGLYHRHQNGKLNRYKLRYRKYVDSNLHFFEIKFKNNKGRTIKDRIKRKEIEFAIEGKADAFLREKTPFTGDLFVPKLWVNYTRMTFVNNHSKERLTVDINLNFKNDNKDITLPNLVIAELKQGKSAKSMFTTVMKDAGVREGSISKYCYGVVYLNEEIKKNNFKPKLLNIKKVCYGSGKINA